MCDVEVSSVWNQFQSLELDPVDSMYATNGKIKLEQYN